MRGSEVGLRLTGMRRFAEAIRAHQEAIAIFQETGDRHGEDAAAKNLESDRAAQSADPGEQ
jgi:hypothetical protein